MKVPPYCGFSTVVVGADVGVIVALVVTVVVVLVVTDVEVVVGVVFVPHDANIRDSAIKQHKINHIVLIFIFFLPFVLILNN